MEKNMPETKDPKQCRCPLRPYLGGMARDSQMQEAADETWREQHEHHWYARVRDGLARAIQSAEWQVGSGEAVLQMVKEILGEA
jgi:hypothetical protein